MPHAIEAREPKLQLSDLPRELVEEILSHMPTKGLVVVSATSKFIHDIATYLINQRLRHVLQMEGYKLINECYDPADKYNHPYNHCEYMGTFVDDSNPNNFCRKNKPTDFEDLSPLPKLYTHFMPNPYDVSAPLSGSLKPASSIVTLDAGEFFTQVCTSACLVRTGPKRGLFESVIPVFENFFRVRRNWLDECCEQDDGTESDGRIMWVGMGEDIGLKLRVSGRRVLGAGASSGVRGREEDPSVEYRIEYEGLVIRATYLLEMIEQRKHMSYYQNISLAPQPVSLFDYDVPVLAF